ncbi:protein kintoun-like [Anomaloglossus baeobatrachus]|uniref:protein kintoun-like n=1 Tax=Anomaloglossus baeobatrachus TaxID=238106 RepID=UPI003F4FB2F0
MQCLDVQDLNLQELFTKYVAETRDSENRRRYEQDMQEIARQKGYDVQFIQPQPCYVLRTIVNGRNKAYVNVCISPEIQKPHHAPDTSEESGQHWTLPYVINPARQELDPEHCRVLVYDVVFHPDTLQQASQSDRFSTYVDLTALTSVSREYRVQVDTENFQIMANYYMGRERPTFIIKPIPGEAPKPQGMTDAQQSPSSYNEQKSGETTQPPTAASDRTPSTPETTQPPTAASDHRPPPETTQPPTAASDRTPSTPETTLLLKAASDHRPSPLEPTIPEYTMRHRSFFSLQDFQNSRDSAPNPVPQELVITVYLPLLNLQTAINLQIHPKDLSLESYNPAYKLQLNLPYLVEDSRGRPQLDETKKQLVITLPVIQQDPSPSLMPTPLPTKKESPQSNGASKCPLVTCSQDATTVTLLIHVKDIDQHSVTSEVSSYQCEVRFCVKTSNAPCVLFVAFLPQYGLNTNEIAVNVSADNMVIELTKSTDNFGPWKSLYYGVNSNTLQETRFSNEKNMADSLPPSTIPWSTQINILEMTDRRTHIRLKSRAHYKVHGPPVLPSSGYRPPKYSRYLWKRSSFWPIKSSIRV